MIWLTLQICCNIERVQELQKFLHYLGRSDVTELVFQSGAAASAKKDGELRAVTRERLSARHILKLVQGTPFQSLVPAADGASEPMTTEIDGVQYVATMARSGEMLLLRLRREGRDTRPPERSIDVSVPREPSGRHRPSSGAQPVEPAAQREAMVDFVRADQPVEVPEALRSLLEQARSESASDVHIMGEEPPRFRRAGRLVPVGERVSDRAARALIMKLLDERNRRQLEELGYADFACQIRGAGRVRVNVNEQRSGIKACFRMIMAEPPTLASLGLPHELREILSYHQGLVVVSGPNGAGKTTTLAALVDLFNSERSVHIITIEDPVEVLHPIKKAIVTQREVGLHTKSFQNALKASLREDPDVIAIGELRDRETVEKALEAAETGHLVFATMSTPSGARTIDRLIDMFPPDDQSQVRATLAGVLKFVVSQRLVPRRDGEGKVAAVELLTGGMALWTLIRDDKLYQLPSLLQRGRAFGMIRIEDSLNELLSAGVISADQARTFADDPRLIGQSPQASSGVTQSAARSSAARNPFARKSR